jgi:hypothetical protein|eukprot:5503815-Prymnesium_polylepis.1
MDPVIETTFTLEAIPAASIEEYYEELRERWEEEACEENANYAYSIQAMDKESLLAELSLHGHMVPMHMIESHLLADETVAVAVAMTGGYADLGETMRSNRDVLRAAIQYSDGWKRCAYEIQCRAEHVDKLRIQNWTFLRRKAAVLGRVSLVLKSLHEETFRPGGSGFKRARKACVACGMEP